jgi:BirA family biotin operon repressor/biotin-[acetyl-CoA-carboxylase] ligase
MSAVDAEAIAIRAALAPDLARRLGALECIAAIDSTNAELLRRGAAQPDHAVLIADAQTHGRGRRGREWRSPPGANLYLSLFRCLRTAPRALGGLSLAVGIVAAEALHALGAHEVRLKWPNDLLARGRKLGGVLVELAPEAAVIGIGINLAMPPAHGAAIEQPWIDLQTLGMQPTRAQVAAAVLSRLLPALDAFERDGLAPFRARWDALDAFAGAALRLQSGHEFIDGTSLGLADDGGLRVACAQGERVFHSADVSLRPA